MKNCIYMSAPIIVSARKMPFMISSSWILVACRFSYYRHYSLERPTQSKAAWLAMFDDFLLIFVYFPMIFDILLARSLRVLWPPFPLQFLIENNKEIAPEANRSSGLLFVSAGFLEFPVHFLHFLWYNWVFLWFFSILIWKWMFLTLRAPRGSSEGMRRVCADTRL